MLTIVRAGLRAAPITLLAAAALAAQPAPPAQGAAGEVEAGYDLLDRLLSRDERERRAAARTLGAVPDPSLIPALVDAVFFTPKGDRGEILAVLRTLTGESFTDYYDWVEYVGRRGDLEPRAGYAGWKGTLLQRIDPRYREILHPGVTARIRLEEVVWGGVPVGGIPALTHAPVVEARGAHFLDEAEQVFGVEIGGESRAYPLSVLGWHEMANDTVGGEPVVLSYCTLCRSALLYSRRAARAVHSFGTSGLLYRSNKLMYDTATASLWSNLTGEAVVGRYAAEGARLELLPLTLTTWGAWRGRHPETTVLDVPGLQKTVGRRLGFDYRPGASDRAREGVSFPVWLEDPELPRDAEVYALRVGGAAKAYPLDAVLAERVINDRLGGEPLVLVAEAASGAVRAYRRGGRSFRAAADGLVDEAGHPWRVEEEALVPPPGLEGAAPLARLPGHVAVWFGWYGFFPDTEVYRGAGGADS